jgi:hypothetical protein
MNGTPFSNRLNLSAPRILRHDFFASSVDSNASPKNVARDRQFLVRVILCRTVANVDLVGCRPDMLPVLVGEVVEP